MSVGLVLGGLAVGFVVGLTGMGGGALMTPMLVFFFGVNPLAAVSSDLVTSAMMKPFGGAVHAHRGTVNRALVGWLALGSVPSAFVGVLVLRALGSASAVDDVVTMALGAALVVAALALIANAYVSMSRGVRDRATGGMDGDDAQDPLRSVVRPLPTVLTGVVGGLVVGMTSVGSGSLMIIALMVIYPRLQASHLVGTDLVQAVPLVAAAALGHLLFGDFRLNVTASLLLGSIPGVILGALASSRAPGGLIRRALAVVLLASGLKLLGVATTVTVVVLMASIILGPLAWMGARRRHGLPALRNQSNLLGQPHRNTHC
ncbi:MAG: sulfite exporter TauE/SafE family protein [Pseudonocardiales bacterium]|nr:MAG: sulfite exporter TauE/SafE family protein [Pseudonocardiales bacterium]